MGQREPKGYGELARLRVKAGLNQSEAAHRLGTWVTQVSRWERGLSQPSVAHLERMARVYGSNYIDVCNALRLVARKKRNGKAAAA